MPDVEPVTSADFPCNMWLSISVWDRSEFDADIGLLFAAAQHEKCGWPIRRFRMAFFRFGGNPLEYRLYGNGPWAAPTPWGRIQTIMSPAIFPAPDHDHESCTSAAIAHAETQCVTRGQRLTPMRRQVLEALLSSHRPLGAYEIIDRLQQKTRPSPSIARWNFCAITVSFIGSRAATPLSP